MTVIFQDTLAKGVIVIFHAKLDSKYKFVNIIFSYSPKRKQFIWHAKEVNEFVKNQFREGILRPRFQKKKTGSHVTIIPIQELCGMVWFALQVVTQK